MTRNPDRLPSNKQITLPFQWGGSNPGDSKTYYAGAALNALTETDDIFYVLCPVGGIISAAMIHTYATTTAGSAESIVMSLRKNAATDYTLATVGLAAATRDFINYSMSASVAKGDRLALKIVTPAWVTNPVGWVGSGVIVINVY